MPSKFKDFDECRPEIKQYGRHLDAGTDDNDSEKRTSGSTKRYKQDLKWFDYYLDENNIDSVSDVGSSDALNIGYTLSEEYNGSTGVYRWNTIHGFYKWSIKKEIFDTNPLEKWNDNKKKEFGLTKSPQQVNELDDGEKYALSQDEIRLMEKNVGNPRIPRIRNQLLIRLMWQTGVRRAEASEIILDNIDREAREIELPSSITKNGKKRVVAYQPNLDGLLRQWVDGGYRDECLAKLKQDEDDENENNNDGEDEMEYLFVGIRGKQLSPEAINEVVKKSADNAGLNRRLYADANSPVDEDGNREKNRWKITSHNIRHGLGTYLVNETDMDVYSVSKYLGHSSVDITESIYVEEDPRAGTEEGARFGPK